MDFIATVLGLQLPTFRARDCLKQRQVCSHHLLATDAKIFCEYDEDMLEVPDKAACDDETASTLSDCDSFTSSTESLGACVTFASPLVTATYFRPVTGKQEKEDLYYRECDYRQFRLDFRRSLISRRTSVTFSATLVSHIHHLPSVENKNEIYYSSEELKQYVHSQYRRSFLNEDGLSQPLLFASCSVQVLGRVHRLAGRETMLKGGRYGPWYGQILRMKQQARGNNMIFRRLLSTTHTHTHCSILDCCNYVD
jgi:hypothetical protein